MSMLRRTLLRSLFGYLSLTSTLAHAHGGGPVNRIEYLGTTFQTARTYRDFQAYQDASEPQFAGDVLRSVQAKVLGHPFGPIFKTQQDLDDQFEALRFPGYGSFYANQLGAKQDPALELLFVEVPRLAQNRYLAVERLPSGVYRVAADFAAPAVPEIVRVRPASNDLLEFMSRDGGVVMRIRRALT